LQINRSSLSFLKILRYWLLSDFQQEKTMLIRNIAIASLAAAGLALLLWRVAVRQSRLVVESGEVHFPTVSGFNLDRQEFEFPRDFAGDLNILFVPFLQQQQLTVNTWIPFAQDIEASFPGVVYYELPTINEMPMLSRTFVNEGMRAGIPDQKSRERTITLYIDLEKFLQATGIPDRNEVHTLLVNRSGEILWRTTGNFSEQQGQDMLAAIQAIR
jgi:hypothetical protein